MGLQRRTISFAKTHSSRAENGRSKFRRYNTRGWEGGNGICMRGEWVVEQRVSLCFTRKWHKYVCVCVCVSVYQQIISDK